MTRCVNIQALLAAAVARCQALAGLRGVPVGRCLGAWTLRADALFGWPTRWRAPAGGDVAGAAVPGAGVPAGPRRARGARATGRIDDERRFGVLARGRWRRWWTGEARAWIAGHDVIDHRAAGPGAGRGPAGVPPGRGGVRSVEPGAGRGRAIAYPRPACAAPRAASTSTTGPATARAPAGPPRAGSTSSPPWTGHLRTAWAAVMSRRTTPATRTAQTIAQARAVVRRLRATGGGRGHGGPAARLQRRLQRRRPHRRAGRLPRSHPGPAGPRRRLLRATRGRLAWQERPPRPPGTGKSTAWSRRTSRRPPPRQAPRARGKPLDRAPSRTRSSFWSRHPALRHRPGRGMARRPPAAPRRPGLVRGPQPAARPARHPRPRHRRPPARRPRPPPPALALARRPRAAVPRWALARLPRQVRHRARLQAPQGHPRPHRHEGKSP